MTKGILFFAFLYVLFSTSIFANGGTVTCGGGTQIKKESKLVFSCGDGNFPYFEQQKSSADCGFVTSLMFLRVLNGNVSTPDYYDLNKLVTSTQWLSVTDQVTLINLYSKNHSNSYRVNQVFQAYGCAGPSIEHLFTNLNSSRKIGAIIDFGYGSDRFGHSYYGYGLFTDWSSYQYSQFGYLYMADPAISSTNKNYARTYNKDEFEGMIAVAVVY